MYFKRKTYAIIFTAAVSFLSAAAQDHELVGTDSAIINVTPPVSDNNLWITHPLYNYDKVRETTIHAGTLIQPPIKSIGINPDGHIFRWDKGGIYGYGMHYPFGGMADIDKAALYLTQSFGRLSINANIHAAHYGTFCNVSTQLGLSGKVSWKFSDHVSISLFGALYNTNPYFSHAMAPFVSTSNYGGFITAGNHDTGVSLGMRREYDPTRGRWMNQPIIAPLLQDRSGIDADRHRTRDKDPDIR